MPSHRLDVSIGGFDRRYRRIRWNDVRWDVAPQRSQPLLAGLEQNAIYGLAGSGWLYGCSPIVAVCRNGPQLRRRPI